MSCRSWHEPLRANNGDIHVAASTAYIVNICSYQGIMQDVLFPALDNTPCELVRGFCPHSTLSFEHDRNDSVLAHRATGWLAC